MSFVSLVFVTSLLCAVRCLGQFSKGNGHDFRQYEEANNQNREESAYSRLNMYRTSSDTEQSLKKKMLDGFMKELLHREALANAKEDEPLSLLNKALAEEQADRLTPISQYVGIGYNLLKGNPDGSFESGGIDPGLLTTQRIFEFTYDSGRKSWFQDTEVNVPDQVNFHSVESCSEDSTNTVFSGAKSYRKSLTLGGGVDGKVLQGLATLSFYHTVIN